MINVIGVDGLVMQKVIASAAMMLAYVSLNILVSTLRDSLGRQAINTRPEKRKAIIQSYSHYRTTNMNITERAELVEVKLVVP